LSRNLTWFGASHKSKLDMLWLRNRKKKNFEAMPGLMKPCVLIKSMPAGDVSGKNGDRAYYRLVLAALD